MNYKIKSQELPVQCPKCNHHLEMEQETRKDKPGRILYKCRNYKCRHSATYDLEGNRLAHKRLTEATRREIFSLYDIGLTYREISERVGFSVKTICKEITARDAEIISQYNKKVLHRLK